MRLIMTMNWLRSWRPIHRWWQPLPSSSSPPYWSP